IFGEVVAVDAALDAGDVVAAAGWIDGWPDASRNPWRAGRLVRRLRYEGRLEEARAALEIAGARASSVDRALLAQGKAARARVREELDRTLAPERRWLLAYLR